MKDAVISEENFNNLVSKFNPGKISTYELHDYHHLEYLWSQTAHNDVYPHIMKIVEENSQL
jgi:hypothetical protein